MPLVWWKQYNLTDYTQEDGPEKDPDGDGFSNREEMNAKTDPTNAEDRPNYITKLACDSINSSEYEIGWTQGSQGGEGNFLFIYNGVPHRFNNLAAGSVFPDAGFRRENFVERFEILRKGQDPSKSGDLGEFFLIKDRLLDGNNEFRVYYRDRKKFNDWKAKMYVKIDLPGVNKQFSLAEGDTFSLPFDPDAKIKPFKFLRLKDDKVLLFKHNIKGLKSPLEIPKPSKK